MTTSIATRNWHAHILSGLMGEDRKLTVTGEVEVAGGAYTPSLARAHADASAEDLVLNLIVEPGDGTTAFTWKPVRYSQSIPTGTCEKVRIRHDAEEVARVPVQLLQSVTE